MLQRPSESGYAGCLMRSLESTFALAMVVGWVMVAGCATSDGSDEELDSTSQEARTVCTSSDDCAADKYCTTEDGVCNSTCKPNVVCTDVCAGTCKKGERAPTPPPPPTCDYSDPSTTWVSQDADYCQYVLFLCVDGFEVFFNECGCGCRPAP
jgi:hypothetical protein